MSVTVSSSWEPEEIVGVAKCQRYLIWLILLQIIGLFLSFGAMAGSEAGRGAQAVAGAFGLLILMAQIVIRVLSIYGVYKMAQSLRKGTAILYAVGTLLPLIGLIVLLVLNGEATRLLQASGVKVGLMGADADDLQRIQSQVGVTA